MMRPIRLAVGWLLLLGASAQAATETTIPSYRAPKIDVPPSIDGKLDEPIWSREPAFELAYQFEPGENEPAPVATRFWLAYGVDALYIAARADDPQPDLIRARFSDRDKAFQEDFLGVILDTFGDERRAYQFLVNPLGVQMDLIRDDVTGREDSSWDGLWHSAGRIDERGYTVELAIPWSTFRFPSGGGPQTWRIHAVRNWPRQHRYQLSLVPIDRNRGCFLCQAARLEGLEGIQPGRSVELAPTLVGAQERLAGSSSRDTLEGGLTARWGMTSNVTLQGAWNPDFSQVETDSLQLDVNTRFALFYPEKRPLFLEAADLFSTRIQAVNTRAISDPNWALRATGKRERDAFGLVVAEDERTNLLLPGPEGSRLAGLASSHLATILRYRRDLPLSGSTLGLLYTGREGGEYRNRVGGLDLFLRPAKGHSVRLEALGSSTRYPEAQLAALEQPPGTLEGHALRLAYSFSSSRWDNFVLYENRSPDFRADLGFVPQVDIERWVLGSFRFFRSDGSKWYSEILVGGDIDETRDHRGDLLEREAEFRARVSGALESGLGVGPRWRRTLLAGRELDEVQLDLEAELRPSGSLYFYFWTTVGDRADLVGAREGSGWQIQPALWWTPGRKVTLALEGAAERLDLAEGMLFQAWVARLRAEVRFDTRTGVRWIGQWVDVERNPDLYGQTVERRSRGLVNQILFSWKLQPQTVAYFGYSDSSSAQGVDRIDLRRDRQTLFVKLGYSWSP